MTFAAVFGASLWSGYALPACHPENRTQLQTAEAPLIESGNLSRRTQPPLNISRANQDKGSTRGKIKRAAWDDAFLLELLAAA